MAEFIDNRFEPWARSRFEKTSPKTWVGYYRVGLSAIKRVQTARRARSWTPSQARPSLISPRIDKQLECKSARLIALFKCCVRILRLAIEWGAISGCPDRQDAAGSAASGACCYTARRSSVLEQPPLICWAAVAAVLVDTGLRPEECFQTTLGIDHLDEWPFWNADCYARQNRCRSPRSADDASRQENSGNPLE